MPSIAGDAFVAAHRQGELGAFLDAGGDHLLGAERRVAAQHDRAGPARAGGGDGLLDLGGGRAPGGGLPQRSRASAITGAACAVEMVVICGDRPSRSSARLAILACPNEAPCLWCP